MGALSTHAPPAFFSEVSDPAGSRPLQRRVGRMAPSETLRSIQGAVGVRLNQ